MMTIRLYRHHLSTSQQVVFGTTEINKLKIDDSVPNWVGFIVRRNSLWHEVKVKVPTFKSPLQFTTCLVVGYYWTVSLRLMTSQFKDFVKHTKLNVTKTHILRCMVQNFVWNFKGDFLNQKSIRVSKRGHWTKPETANQINAFGPR